MQTRVLSVPDISCGHCETVIKKALHSIPGIGAVAVDISKRQVEVFFDEAVFDFRDLGGILASAGYPIESETHHITEEKQGSNCCGSCSA